ncbi:MAG: ComF family protein, partial [Nitrospirae bacterium]
PLGRKRMLERGFSQSYHLAKEISRKKSLPLLDDLVIRKRNTPPQSLLPRKERLRNLRDAFELRRQEGKPLPESILIVDDVMTTGATLSEMGKLLKKNGVRRVHALVLARSEID